MAASNPRYCKYGCDYMCNVCQAEELKDINSGKNVPMGPVNQSYNPLDDDIDDNAMMWAGYPARTQEAIQLQVDEYGELTGFPLTKYSQTSQTVTGTTTYAPPPLKQLKEKALLVIIDEPVVPVSPDKLIPREIIT